MEDWRNEADVSPDVRAVLASLAVALLGRLPTPALLEQLAETYIDAVPQHRAKFEHVGRPPKGTKPRPRARYTLSIVGPRIDGRWTFSPGQLAKLLETFRQKDSAASTA